MASQRPHRRGTQAVEEATATGGEATPALAVEELSKQFGSGPDAVMAVDGVSFQIERGTVVGLLGPNGAGKTTTIKSILGLVLPDAGRVRIQGIDMNERPRAAYRHVDAMLEGARNDYWRLTVRENLRYFSTIKGVKPNAVADRHERLLAKLDLLEKADEPVRDLSRGMKQKVSLASVLASESDLVFLDEPTLGLDVESSLTLRRELRRIVDERDLTAVVSSHDMDVIEDVCDRVIIMNEGEIIADDSVAAVLDQFTANAFVVTSPDITDGLLATIRERFEVVDVTSVERGRRVEVATDSDGFYRLLDLCQDHDVTLAGVGTVEPDLEDVFVEITGQER